MDDHVAAVCKAAFYHIRALRHIRPAITDKVAKTVTCSVVGARLDYANSVLYGVLQKNIHRLQRIQNILARVVAGLPNLVPQTFSTIFSGYLLTFISSSSLLNLHSFLVPHHLLISHHSSAPVPRLAIFVLAILFISIFLNTGYK
jgi:hypothetical protein